MAEHPWQRQSGEPSRCYSAFCIYRDMGPERSLRKAIEHFLTVPANAQSTKRQRQQRRFLTHSAPDRYRRHVLRSWARWSKRWAWVERAQAWDDHVHELTESDRLESQLRLRQEEIEENERQRRLRREEGRAARTVARLILRRVLKAVESQELEGLPLAQILPHLQKVGMLIELGHRLEQEEEIEGRLAALETTLRLESPR